MPAAPLASALMPSCVEKSYCDSKAQHKECTYSPPAAIIKLVVFSDAASRCITAFGARIRGIHHRRILLEHYAADSHASSVESAHMSLDCSPKVMREL